MVINRASFHTLPAARGMFQPDRTNFKMSSPSPSSEFPATRWTLVRSVQKGGEVEAAQALEQLCRSYWYPIYAYARRRGLAAEDAEDITQAFFHNLVTYHVLQDARQEKGRLRGFMLGLLKRVMAKQHRHDIATKRGGARPQLISFQDSSAEARYSVEAADQGDADLLFDRAWASGILAEAEAKLRADYVKAENVETFEALREFLPLGDNVTPYSDVARRLGIGEATMRLQIHRMRKRYGKLIEDGIAQTVSSPEELKSELAHLMAVIGEPGRSVVF